jgi:Protein of unknown function (DUF3606)
MVTNEIGPRDDQPRINVGDYFELRRWAKHFEVTSGEVRRAVTQVGDLAADVEAYLARARPTVAPSPADDARWSR